MTKKITQSEQSAPKQGIKQIISQVAEESQDKKPFDEAQGKEELIQLVVFSLDQEEYGINITDISEIIKIPQITPIPTAPKFIRGILNLRGKIVVVVDLEKRFALTRQKPVEPKHIIIAQVEENSFGILVDEVEEVLRVPVASIQPAPALVSAKIHADYLKGVVVLETQNAKLQTQNNDSESEIEETQKSATTESQKESRLIILIDLLKMLEEKELLSLGEVVKETTKTSIE